MGSSDRGVIDLLGVFIYHDSAEYEKIVKLMQDNAETIKKITLADELVYDKLDGFTKEWNINGENVTIAVK